MTIEVEAPDGSVVEFPDGTPHDVMTTAMRNKFAPQTPQEQRMRANIADPNKSAGLSEALTTPFQVMGWMKGVHIPMPESGQGGTSRVSRIAGQMLDPTGLSDETAGIVAGAKALASAPMRASYWQGKEAPILDQAGDAYTNAAENIRAERKIARERNTILPEVVGGLLQAPLMPAIGAERTAISATTPIANKLLNAAANANLYGAVTGAAQGTDIGSRAENALFGGAIGTFAGPVISEGIVPAAIHAGRVIPWAARMGGEYRLMALDPEKAAYRDVAGALMDANVTPQALLRAQVTPPPSADLQGIGFKPEDVSTMVLRRLQGENAQDIAADYAHLTDANGKSITPATVNKYLNDYRRNNPTPMNIADLSTELAGEGGSAPVTEQMRTSMAIANDPLAKQRLMGRQTGVTPEMATANLPEQPGQTDRMAGMIQQTGGRDGVDKVLDHLEGDAKEQKRLAYETAYANAKPIDIRSNIADLRNEAERRGNAFGSELQKAADLFHKPAYKQATQSPAMRLRITEAQEKLAEAIDTGKSQDAIDKLHRRFTTLQAQDKFSRSPKLNKIGPVVSDMRRFMDQREALDDMISKAFKGGDNKLGAVLSGFRYKLNTNVRALNPEFATADAMHAADMTIKEILSESSGISKTITPATRQQIRDFRAMSPAMQDIFRITFEDRMYGFARSTKKSVNAAAQFRTGAFDDLVKAFYPKGTPSFKVGQDMIRNLRREDIASANSSYALHGSRTAPLGEAMAAEKDKAGAGVALALGKLGTVYKYLENILIRRVGIDQAKERMKILTETNPPEMLRILKRLDDTTGKVSEHRKAMDEALRLTLQSGRRSAPIVGVASGYAMSQDQQPTQNQR